MYQFIKVILLFSLCFWLSATTLFGAAPLRRKRRPFRYENREGIMIEVTPTQRKKWASMRLKEGEFQYFDYISVQDKQLVIHYYWRQMCHTYLPYHLSGKDIYNLLVKCTINTKEEAIEIENFVDYINHKKRNKLMVTLVALGGCMMAGLLATAAIVIDYSNKNKNVVKIALPMTLTPVGIGLIGLVYICYESTKIPLVKKRKKRK